jgi:precorrin-2/cobalt-factor-2 C20-methyltransferase
MAGTLYGIGVGPGDPELMTVKAVRVLASCHHVCVPKAKDLASSIALEIARRYIAAGAIIHETTFLMTADKALLEQSHRQAAMEILAIVQKGEDCCFLTLGDPMLYSTYIYLVRALRGLEPSARVETIPGITAFSAAAALTNFAVGEGKEPVTIVPGSDDFAGLSWALDGGGTVVLMKVGGRLQKVLDELDGRGLLEHAVFVSHAGQAGQRIETDLRRLRGVAAEVGYLSIMIIQARAGKGGEGEKGRGGDKTRRRGDAPNRASGEGAA